VSDTVVQVGEWRLLADRHSLRHSQTQEERYLGAQNFALLHYLLAHPAELLSREQLLDAVWHGVIVNDNTLSKAIADLRKALNDDSKQPRYILTVPKRGYRWLATVQSADAAAVTEVTPATKTVNVARRIYIGALLILLLLALIAWRFWPVSDKAATALEIRPFTSDAGLEMNASFSFDGQWLAYVALPKNATQTLLMIKSLNGRQRLQVDSRGGAIETPTWSTRQWYLAYLHREGDDCTVQLRRFNADNVSVDEARAIDHCAPASRTGFASLQWSADGESLIYQRLNAEGQRQLVRHYWREQRTQVLDVGAPTVFALHPHRDDMAYASIEPMSTSLMVQTLVDGHSESQRWLTRSEVFLGLAWDSDRQALLTTTGLAGGRLERIMANGERHTLFVSNSPLIWPQYSAATKTIALTQLTVKHDLWRDQLASRYLPGKSAPQASAVIASNHFDYSPQFAHSGSKLAFISNRSGKPDVWTAFADGGEQQRLIDLPDEQWPVNLQWSPDDRYLLIGTSAMKILRYDLIADALETLTPESVNAINPRWSLDGKQIFYAVRQQDEWQITRYDVDHKTHQASGLSAALYAPSADGASAYLLRYGNSEQRGVWLVDLKTQQQQRLMPALDRFNWQNFHVATQGFYFLQSVAGKWQVQRWTPSDGTKTAYALTTDAMGPLFVDFAIDPKEQHIVFTHIDDWESDIVLLQ